jgi:hypothetical protein
MFSPLLGLSVDRIFGGRLGEKHLARNSALASRGTRSKPLPISPQVLFPRDRPAGARGPVPTRRGAAFGPRSDAEVAA